MDDLSVYLVGAAVLVIAIIFINHRRQKNKVNSFLQDSGDMQPVFMLKAIEKKVNALAEILYEDGIKPARGDNSQSRGNGQKQMLIQQLEQLERDFNNKKITLRSYDDQLFQLLEKAKKLPATAPVN